MVSECRGLHLWHIGYWYKILVLKLSSNSQLRDAWYEVFLWGAVLNFACNSPKVANRVFEPSWCCDFKNTLLYVESFFFFFEQKWISNPKATYKPSDLTFSFCLTLKKKVRGGMLSEHLHRGWRVVVVKEIMTSALIFFLLLQQGICILCWVQPACRKLSSLQTRSQSADHWEIGEPWELDLWWPVLKKIVWMDGERGIMGRTWGRA